LLRETDGILLETWSEPSALDAARAVHQRLPTIPVLVSFTFAPNEADKAAALATHVTHPDVAAIGVNCGRQQTPNHLANPLCLFRKATHTPMFARPNAGSPMREENRWIYPTSPLDWARQMMCISNVAMLGGCCGTTPEHIRELRRLLGAQKKSPA